MILMQLFYRVFLLKKRTLFTNLSCVYVKNEDVEIRKGEKRTQPRPCLVPR